jgi:hypothetical protein
MIIGIAAGTYSSVYVASSFALALGITQEDLIRKDKGKPRDTVEEELKAEFLEKEALKPSR